MNRNSLLAAYLRQQKELGMPDMVFGNAEKIKSLFAPPKVRQNSGATRNRAHAGRRSRQEAVPHVPEKQGQAKNPYGRLSRLPPASIVAEPGPSYEALPWLFKQAH